jgi:hypothetical protein
MINLPINERELDRIIEILKHSQPDLHAKLWSHKINNLKNGK